MKDPLTSLSKRADIICGAYFLREKNLLPKPAKTPSQEVAPQFSYKWQPTRLSFWDSCLGRLVMVLAVLALCTGFVVGGVALLLPNAFSFPATTTASASKTSPKAPALSILPPNSVQLGTTVLTCSGAFNGSSATPNTSFVGASSLRKAQPFSSLIGANPFDGIGNAINGCAQAQAPVLDGGSSNSASSSSTSSSSGITLVCKSQITIVMMVTLGDRPAYDPQMGGWYPLGRLWPSADPQDYVLRNPDIDPVTGLSTGDNLNIYVFNGPVTVKLPGHFLMVAHGSSSDSVSMLQGLYFSPRLASYHIILKRASLDDAELVAQTIGVDLPYGEVDY